MLFPLMLSHQVFMGNTVVMKFSTIFFILFQFNDDDDDFFFRV